MNKEEMRMQGASRPGGRPLNCPHQAHPQPIIHRKRHRPEYVDGYQLRGKEYWMCMVVTFLSAFALALAWWISGM